MSFEPTPAVITTCPACGAHIDVTDREPFAKVACTACTQPMRVRTSFHHYELQALAGTGGMSRVFRAHDTSLDRPVALKILNRACSRDGRRLRQFEKEAEVTARISHPNVVKVYTAGRDQGYFYIAMELVSGGSLEDVLRKDRKMPEARVLEMAVQLVQGLKAAHEAGLIHRDLKPGNVLFSEDGTAKIVDFGLAVFARDGARGGEIWATPYYVPPETLYHHAEDFRSDIYSLGATLYHVLTGRPACDKDTSSLEELKRLKAHPVTLKPAEHGLSAETCAMLERSLAVRPQDRYRSYDEFLHHLRFAQRRLRRGGKGRPWPGRVRVLSLWQKGALAATLALAGAGVWFAASQQDGDEDEQVPLHGPVSLVTDADPTAGSDSNTSARFLAARNAMLDGDFGKARQWFDELAGAEGTRQPTRSWAAFNAALCALFMRDTAGARDGFAALERAGPYSGAADDRELAEFFVRTAGWLAQPGPVHPDKIAGCPTDSVRAIGLLAAGVKNWEESDAPGAVTFLRRFMEAMPPRTALWVDECKRLARRLLADAEAIAALPATEAVNTGTLDEARALVARAADTVAKTVSKGGARALAEQSVAALAAALMERDRHETAREAGARSELVAKELALIAVANEQAVPLGETRRFEEAAASLMALAVTTAEAKATADIHIEAWNNARQFVEQLQADLALKPVEGSLDKPDGTAVRGTLSAASGHIRVKPAQGAVVSVPVTQINPACLVRIAESVLPHIPDSDGYYQRREWLYCFTLRTGLTESAEEIGAGMAREFRPFRHKLAVLNGAPARAESTAAGVFSTGK